MLRLGLMRQACSGFYHLLPMGYRVLEKLAALVDRHLQAIGAVKMAMPMMTPSNLWKRSGKRRLPTHLVAYYIPPVREGYLHT